MTDYDIYMTYLSWAIFIAEILTGGYCFFLLAKSFMDSRMKAACVGAAYSFAMLTIYMVPWRFTNFAAYGLGCFFAFLVMCLAERKNYRLKVFLAVVFFSLHWFAFAMADILQDELNDVALKKDYLAAHPNHWFAIHVALYVFWLAVNFAFMAVSIRFISKNCDYKDTELSLRELFVLTIPSVMGVLGFESMWYYRTSYLAENGRRSDIYDMLAVFYCVAAVIAMVVVIVSYRGIRAQQEEKIQNGLLAAQMDSIRRHIGQVESLYQSIRSIRHDMANHIITLERLYAGNKAEEAKAYTLELKAALAEAAGDINSGNPVTDVILQEMRVEAEKRKIRFDMDFHYPTGAGVNAFDISVILNNALQNALDNAEKGGEPYISILSYRRNNAYMIEIHNSFTGNLQWDEGKGLPVTSKGKGDIHGYGLANIRKVAGKYFGDIDVTLRNGDFCLSIMLMLE